MALPPSRLGKQEPQDLLAVVRDHWAIENRLHYRRDVTLREDACQVRKGEAPRVLAVLNSFLLAVLDFLGVSNVPSQMRTFDAHPLVGCSSLIAARFCHSYVVAYRRQRAWPLLQWQAELVRNS